MSLKRCTLRALVNERLTAAAEEIFALVERTIVEYEEELCRSKEENQRKQRLLDSVLNLQNLASQSGVQIQVASPEDAGPRSKQNIFESATVKEEPADFCFVQPVCVKSEESPAPQQAPEGGDETPGDADRVWSKLWEPPASTAEADGDHYNQVQIKDTSTTAHNSGLFNIYQCGAESTATVTETDGNHYGHAQIKDTSTTVHVSGPFGSKSPSEASYLGNVKVHECSFCEKRFTTNQSLQIHIRVHTGEKPYSCPFCKKCFTQKAHLKTHIRTHTKEKPYMCSVCLKSFMHKVSLNLHMEKTHPDLG